MHDPIFAQWITDQVKERGRLDRDEVVNKVQSLVGDVARAAVFLRPSVLEEVERLSGSTIRYDAMECCFRLRPAPLKPAQPPIPKKRIPLRRARDSDTDAARLLELYERKTSVLSAKLAVDRDKLRTTAHVKAHCSLLGRIRIRELELEDLRRKIAGTRGGGEARSVTVLAPKLPQSS